MLQGNIQQQYAAVGPIPRIQQTAVRPNEPFEQILQRPVPFQQQRQPEQMPTIKLNSPQVVIQSNQKPVVPSQQVPTNNQSQTTEQSSTTEQEIPDNVTAELEKLEQEGSMVELQGVGDILGGIGDDEDELLGEDNN